MTLEHCRLRIKRRVIELPRHAAAADESKIVTKTFADRHDRRLQPLLAVFPSDRCLRGILIGGDAGRFRAREEAIEAQVFEEAEVRIDANDAIEITITVRLARQH